MVPGIATEFSIFISDLVMLRKIFHSRTNPLVDPEWSCIDVWLKGLSYSGRTSTFDQNTIGDSHFLVWCKLDLIELRSKNLKIISSGLPPFIVFDIGLTNSKVGRNLGNIKANSIGVEASFILNCIDQCLVFELLIDAGICLSVIEVIVKLIKSELTFLLSINVSEDFVNLSAVLGQLENVQEFFGFLFSDHTIIVFINCIEEFSELNPTCVESRGCLVTNRGSILKFDDRLLELFEAYDSILVRFNLVKQTLFHEFLVLVTLKENFFVIQYGILGNFSIFIIVKFGELVLNEVITIVGQHIDDNLSFMISVAHF